MEIKVEGKNKKYANLLKQNYCSKFSDLTSYLLYKYENYLFFENDPIFSNNMNKLSNDSLTHFEVFGRLITMLGSSPNHIGYSVSDFFYIDDKTKLLEINIRLTKEKIILYTKNMGLIEDKYIKSILSTFIIEERKNLEILELLQLKNKREKNKKM